MAADERVLLGRRRGGEQYIGLSAHARQRRRRAAASSRSEARESEGKSHKILHGFKTRPLAKGLQKNRLCWQRKEYLQCPGTCAATCSTRR